MPSSKGWFDTRAALAASWLCCVGLSACVDNGSSAASPAVARPEAPTSGSVVEDATTQGALPILDRMERSQETTAFRGLRRVVDHENGARLEQLEDVGADGTGQFSIELADAVVLPAGLSTFTYELVFESSARFYWSMRDFQVRDAAQVASNYAVTMLADTPMVAGIECVRVDFVRNALFGGRPGHYVADVDPDTGFVLAWRELDQSGTATIEVTYETFAYDGDVSDMTLRDRSFAATELSLSSPLDPQTGFPVRVPDLLLGDMQFRAAELITVPAVMTAGHQSYLPTGPWLRMVATDGIEVVVFAHSGVSATLPLDQDGTYRSTARGSWEIGYGRIDGTSFVVAGRGTLFEMEQIVGSAF